MENDARWQQPALQRLSGISANGGNMISIQKRKHADERWLAYVRDTRRAERRKVERKKRKEKA